MLDAVADLANAIRLARDANQKFVLMLGAGASVSSGVKLTKQIMQELVQENARSTDGRPLDERFDLLWRDSTATRREQMLAPYLDMVPSDGYATLVDLIKREFFDAVITFNFDRLLERALTAARFDDYVTLVRGEMMPEQIARAFHRPRPRVKLLKIHGSVHADTLFSKEEMLNYPPELDALLGELTGRDILICGYGFADQAIQRCFNTSPEAGPIYCVAPGGVPTGLTAFMARRRSSARVFKGEYGYFDTFFKALHGALTRGSTPAPLKSRQNPFKFLDHFQEEEQRWFFGRRCLTGQVKAKLLSPEIRGLHLVGLPKVGKTSLVRAGLIPALKAANVDVVYHRCGVDTPSRLLTELRALPGSAGAPDLAAALAGLKRTGRARRTAIFLDQAERICRDKDAAKNENSSLRKLLQALATQAGPELCVVFVAVDERDFLATMIAAKLAQDYEVINVEPLSAAWVATIIKRSACRGGTPLKDTFISKLASEYEKSVQQQRGERAFTLLHVQTICYYLMKGSYSTWEGYNQVIHPGLRAALEIVSEKASLFELLEDLPAHERALFRRVLKIACDPVDADSLVKFIRDRFTEMRVDPFPEPVS